MADARRQIETLRFGTITVSDDEIVDIPDGVPGFPEFQRCVLVPVDQAMFWWLQSTEDPELAFLSVVPWPFFPDYEPEVPAGEQDVLGLSDPGDALVLCLVTVHRDPDRFTANLLAPVVVNQSSRRARQIVLDQDLPSQAELTPPE
ncbi:MAG: flagellar assembly protein FliW [Acidimicrobiales bacterium]|nr:flagellar assembly protein FliW [Acidimicrobiales bacterium]